MKTLWNTALLLALTLAAPALADDTIPLTFEIQNASGQTIVADSFGRALYVFDRDQGQSSSVCVGDCAEVWPPYLLTAAEAGLVAKPLGVIQRANRKQQLTYQGRPVYLYASDRVCGESLGDGLGGVWHVVKPAQ